MTQERTEAVVLRGVDFSETSRIVTFLTPERGKVACLAKGARRAGSTVAGALDTYNHIEIVLYWKPSRSVQTLGDVTLLKGFPNIKSNMEKATYGTYPLELTLKVARENEPSEALFAVLTGGLDALETWKGDVRTLCTWLVVRQLDAAGFAPTTDYCAGCGNPLDRARGFSFETGLTCGNCPSDARLDANTGEQLRRLAARAGACPDLRVSDTTFELIRKYASHHLESDFRSLRVIREIFG